MAKKKNKLETFNCKCNSCGWHGSKYKIIINKNGDFCPNCESEDIVIYGKDQVL